MKPGRALAVVLIACIAAGCLAGCGDEPPDVPMERVLFIGNSFTEINGGIPAQLKGLAPSLQSDAVLVGGATLQDHWNAGTALAKIRAGGWSHVVLQEQSQMPVTGEIQFDQAVRNFSQEIGLHGSRIALLMTWERPDSVQYGVTTEHLAESYRRIGQEVGALVAPAGLAFAESLRERPGLQLCQSDGHPTTAGTYLAACVLYGAVYKRTPVGNPYGPLSDDNNVFLQTVAAKTLGL